jgi:hypothetical protein
MRGGNWAHLSIVKPTAFRESHKEVYRRFESRPEDHRRPHDAPTRRRRGYAVHRERPFYRLAPATSGPHGAGARGEAVAATATSWGDRSKGYGTIRADLPPASLKRRARSMR